MADEFTINFQKKAGLSENRLDDTKTNILSNQLSTHYISALNFVRGNIEQKHSQGKRCFVVIHILRQGVRTRVYVRDDVDSMDAKIKNETFIKYIDNYDNRFMIPICVKYTTGAYSALVSQPWVAQDDVDNYKKELSM